MFKKRESKPKGLRRRERDEDEEDELEDRPNLSASGNSAAAQQQKLKGPRKTGDGVLGFSSSAAKKAKMKEAETEKSTTRFAFESNREVQVSTDNRATASLETETEFDRDARALREKYLKRAEAALSRGGEKSDGDAKAPADDKVYRGATGYIDHTAGFRREHSVSSEKASGAHGPLRASTHVRMTVRFDYQPDICKDYKETGFCGYGDSCKFMHDRGDYKSGWQLEKEWDEKEKRRKEAIAMGMGKVDEEEEEEEEDEDALPFACFICREPFTDPVMTKCQHYFCEHCALKHHVKNKNCFVCNKPTSGVFNTAHEIIRKTKEREAMAKKK